MCLDSSGASDEHYSFPLLLSLPRLPFRRSFRSSREREARARACELPAEVPGAHLARVIESQTTLLRR